MKHKNIKMEFNCFYQDFNSNELVWFNVLNNSLVNEINKWHKSKYYDISTREKLKEQLKHYFMYCYWCKSEFEVIISNWTGIEMEQKVDVWWQIEHNLDLITDIVINAMQISLL